MIELSCPWCEAPLAVEVVDLGDELRCDGCRVAVEVADGDPIVAAAAA